MLFPQALLLSPESSAHLCPSALCEELQAAMRPSLSLLSKWRCTVPTCEHKVCLLNQSLLPVLAL